MGDQTLQYPELQQQINHLTSEVQALRGEFAQIVHVVLPAADDYAREALEEFEQNQRAYEREEASLLAAHRGQWVAFCGGRLVAADADKPRVIEQASRAEPSARPFLRRVGEPIPSRPAGRP